MTESSTHSSSSATGVAVGASITVIAILLIAGGILTVFLRRRRLNQPFKQLAEPDAERAEPAGLSAGRTSIVLDRSHPASRVTPFTPGREPDMPQFTRTPGESMRIARRRSDGGWDFSSPLPSNVLSGYALRPPGLNFDSPSRESIAASISRCSSPTTSSITLVGTQGKLVKEKKLLPGDLTTRGYVESTLGPEVGDRTMDTIPPPAYSPRRGSNRHSYSQSTHF